MRLDAVAATLRPRNAWEATDLGALMIRHWCGPVYRAWFAVALPVFLLLHLLCWGHWGWVPWLFWWLKPLLDRPVLYVLSHALFGAAPDRRRFWRALPGLLRSQALTALTLRRLDPARSFHLPVAQLEGLTGKARRQRLRDLVGLSGRGTAVWLTVVCAHLEIGLDLALIALVWMLIPNFVDLEWYELLNDSKPWGQLWLNLVGFCGMSLVEPFYVAGGFALYLNRRTWLEAWDLELGFRRLAARLTPTQPAAVGLALVLAVTLWVLQPVIAFAGEPVLKREQATPVESAAQTAQTEQSNQTSAAASEQQRPEPTFCERRRARIEELAESTDPIQRALAETLGEPALGTCATKEYWRLRQRDEPESPEGKPAADGLLARWVAAVVEYALWFTLGLFTAVAIWWLWRQRPLGTSRPNARRATAKAVPRTGRHALLEPPDADLGSVAWHLWASGQPREALRVLYRGSLAGLAARHGVPVSTSATEEDCLRVASAQVQDPELLGFFRQLTRAWQATAYAHRPPDEAAARALCQEWPRHFAAFTGAAS